MGAKILATAVSIVAMARASFSDCFIASRLGTSSPKISVKYDRITVIRKIEMVFVMLTNIIEETTYLICEGEHADELVEKAFPVHKEGAYHVLRGVVSRKKQLIPMFMSAMQDQ